MLQGGNRMIAAFDLMLCMNRDQLAPLTLASVWTIR
jgi:hypothetical protein